MDFKSFVDMIDVMTCVISVETKDDGSYGEIRIVDGNPPYIASIEVPNPNLPQMIASKFVPNSLYQKYIPKDLNFEDFCYRCAVLKQPMHTYVHPERYDFWFNLYMLPLQSIGNIHYCTYTQIITKNADSEQMSNTSASTASAVLNTCIKLRGATNFQHTMEEVISDIRKIIDAQKLHFAAVTDIIPDSVHRALFIVSVLPAAALKRDCHKVRNFIKRIF